MSQLIELVAIFAPYIYAICGLTALFQMYRAWQVREERRQALFSYEREKAIRELNGIFFTALLLLLLMGFTYFTSTTLYKAIEPILQQARNPQLSAVVVDLPTPTAEIVTPTPRPEFTATVQTIDLNVTLAAPLTPPLPLETQTPDPAAPATVTPNPNETPIAVVLPPSPTPLPPSSTPVVQFAAPACSDPNSTISSPGNGEVVSGLVSVTGTANHPNFQYYKIEYAPGRDAQSGFGFLSGGNSPVIQGVLASLDVRSLAPGEWTFRLVVVDNTGNFLAPCAVTLVVSG